MDGIRLLRNKEQTNINALLLSVPGVAPGHGNNPAIKLVEYNANNSFALTGFTNYYMDIKEDFKNN